MKITTILDQIDIGSMALPEFQRGYVWNRDQVRGLMHSLYYRHPVGSLLPAFQQTDVFPTAFKADPHWNTDGVGVAVEAILAFLEEHDLLAEENDAASRPARSKP